MQYVQYVLNGQTFTGQTALSVADLEEVIPGITSIQFATTPFPTPPSTITAATLAEAFGIVAGTTSLTDAKAKTKAQLNRLTNEALAPTDWYVSRLVEVGTAIPSAVSTYRASVRTFNNTKTTTIDNALSVSAVVALFAPATSGKPAVFDLPA
jgi:hypothetical protein